MNEELLNNFAKNFAKKAQEEHEELELEDLAIDKQEPVVSDEDEQENINEVAVLDQGLFSDDTTDESVVKNKPYFDNTIDDLASEKDSNPLKETNPSGEKNIEWGAYKIPSSKDFDKFNNEDGTNTVENEKAKEQSKKDISNFLKRQSEEKLQKLLESRFKFAPSAVALNKCVSTNIALAGSGDSMFVHDKIEGCFREDLNKAKERLQKTDEMYNKMLSNPALSFFAFFIIAAKTFHYAIEAPKLAIHNLMEKKQLKELSTFMNLSIEEKAEYLKKMERDIQGYNDNIQSKKGFEDEINKDVEENLNEATKVVSDGKYDKAEDMIADGYFEEDLTDDEIRKLHKQSENFANENSVSKLEQLQKQQVKAQSDYMQASDNLFKLDKELEEIIDNTEPASHSKYFQQAYDKILKENDWTQENLSNLMLADRYATLSKIYDDAAVFAKKDGADPKSLIYKSSLYKMIEDKSVYDITQFKHIMRQDEKEPSLRDYIIDKLEKHDIKADFNSVNSISEQLNNFLIDKKTFVEKLHNDYSSARVVYGKTTKSIKDTKEKIFAAKERTDILNAYGNELKQKDKLALNAADSIFNLLLAKKEKGIADKSGIDDNIDKLEEFAKNNLNKFSDKYNIIKSNSLIMAKILDQEKFELSDEENIKFAKIIQDELHRFHNDFVKTGDMNLKGLEARITARINEEDIGARSKGFKKNIGDYVIDAIDDERIMQENDNPRYVLKDAENLKNIHESIDKINFYNENIRYAGKYKKGLENEIFSHQREKEKQVKSISKHIENRLGLYFNGNNSLTTEEKENIKTSVKDSLARLSKSDKIKDAGGEILKDLAQHSKISERIKECMINKIAKTNPVTGVAVYVGEKLFSSAYDKYKKENEKLNSKQKILEAQKNESFDKGVYRKTIEAILGGNGDKLDIIAKLAPIQQNFKTATKEWFSILTNNVNYSDEINKDFKTDPARFAKILPVKLLFTKLNFATKLSFGERPELVGIKNNYEMTQKTDVDRTKFDSIMSFLKKSAILPNPVMAKGIFQKVIAEIKSNKDGEEAKPTVTIASAIFTQKFDQTIGKDDPFRISSLLKGAGFSNEAISKMPIENLDFARQFSNEALRVLDIQGKEYLNVMQGMLKLKSISGIGDFMKQVSDLKNVVGTQFNSAINANSFARNEIYLAKLNKMTKPAKENISDSIKDGVKNIADFTAKSVVAKAIISRLDTVTKKVAEAKDNNKNIEKIVDTFENFFKVKMK